MAEKPRVAEKEAVEGEEKLSGATPEAESSDRDDSGQAGTLYFVQASRFKLTEKVPGAEKGSLPVPPSSPPSL